jgi:Family of unknown function (DUF5677)
VITCGEAVAATASIKHEGDDASQGLAACLLARSVSTARAVVHLIGLGHVVEARMLARSIFENKFYLYRLAQNGSAFAREIKPRIKDGKVMDTVYLAAMALLGVCISANTTLGGTSGGEPLARLFAEYHEIAAQTLPA